MSKVLRNLSQLPQPFTLNFFITTTYPLPPIINYNNALFLKKEFCSKGKCAATFDGAPPTNTRAQKSVHSFEWSIFYAKIK